MMRKFFSWVCASGLVLAVGACASTSAPAVLLSDATRTGAVGDPDYNKIRVPQISSPQPGRKLKPGDVIYLRVWSPGASKVADWHGYNRSGVSAVTLRVPLRFVEDPRALSGRLHDVEREFLADVIATNVDSPVQTHIGQWKDLGNAIAADEHEVWNALIRTLEVKSLAAGNVLALTVRLNDLKRILNDTTGLLLGANPVDVLGIIDSFASPIYAVTSDGVGHSKNSEYYADINSGPSALFSFVAVELGGVRVQHPGAEEARWTLGEWERSGVCVDGSNTTANIGRIRLTGGDAFDIKDESSLATHIVMIDIGASETIRSIAPNSLHPSGHFSALQARSLARDDLDKLRVEDVVRIDWRTPHGRISANCDLR